MEQNNPFKERRYISVIFLIGLIFYSIAVLLDQGAKILFADLYCRYEIIIFEGISLLFLTILLVGLLFVFLYINGILKKLYATPLICVALAGNIIDAFFEGAFYFTEKMKFNGIICIIDGVIKAFILMFFIFTFRNFTKKIQDGSFIINYGLIIFVLISIVFNALMALMSGYYVILFLFLTPLIGMMESFLGAGGKEFFTALSFEVHLKNLVVSVPYCVSYVLFTVTMFNVNYRKSKNMQKDKFVFKVI